MDVVLDIKKVSMANTWSLLEKHLANLDATNFKKFKFRLNESHQEIGWGKLETADVLDTAKLMVQCFNNNAVGVAVDILKDINVNDVATHLSQDSLKGIKEDLR
ncbi:NACHT, LRR and PYD domains-containing protein 6-like [Acipenser oxyrinchus oxyrinchus]|uniref:NACHT, LRR and PYD domains-containing protein 6-like n=1 Tax=Acipenser oxyrinchus oxyrinchus TaxID=40147 RepID=A0AAD8CHP3_ACIOX|nr:NACHT, LRR and PYD domains-containing protein 6-like [Acipenser oxyrinchus oxyrinchus]